MVKLAIIGHATRGKEVIELLEMLGGKNDRNYTGDLSNYVYTINEHGIIDWYLRYNSFQYVTFTIEEFLEKFPYKVGDKVKNARINDFIGKIVNVRWDSNEEQVIYHVEYGNIYKNVLPYFVNDLQPYMEEKLEQIILDIPDGYEFFDINYENKIVLTKKQLQYPKTCEECCKILKIPTNGDIIYAGNWTFGGEYLDKHLDKIRNLQKLLICRDAYWKIAGEQMGLEKPWEPDWLNTEQDKFVLYTHDNVIYSNCFVLGHNVLAFPTKEMRDIFFKYFKDLIEECKEFL